MSVSSPVPVPTPLLVAALLAGVFSSTATVAQEAPLYAAVYSESLYASFDGGVGLGVQDRSKPTSLVHTGSDGSFDVVSTTHGGSSPSLSVDVDVSGGRGNYYANANARIEYQVELTGAPYGTVVPMTLATSAQVSGVGDVSDAYAYVTFVNYNTNTLIKRETEAYTPIGNFSNSFDEVIPVNMVVGVRYSVDMYGFVASDLGSAHVVVDPTFAFVNAADAGQYALAYSPGLIPAVPEPEPAAMAGAGLAVLALAWARRKPRPPKE